METDFSRYLYERLATDKYGRWIEVFGVRGLERLCERIADEAYEHFDDADDLVDKVADLEEQVERLTKELEDHEASGVERLRC